jgi:hypothetical protein
VSWIVGFLIIAGAIWMMVVSKTFRWVVLGLLGAMGVGIYLLISHENRSGIGGGEIAADQLEIAPKLGGSSGYWHFRGEVTNRSSHTLSGFTTLITLHDCPTKTYNQNQCRTIAQDSTRVNVSVPPNQVRQFDSLVTFYGMPNVRGQIVWWYHVEEITAAD